MNNPPITRTSALFLQAVVVLIGIGTLAFLLWEPHVEGVNANAASLYDIYFDDPFLAYAYVASVPFFVALYQVFTLLGYAGSNTLFSRRSARALQAIRYCAMAMVPLIVTGVVWLLLSESDDRPPVLAMGAVATLLSIAVAVAASACERMLRRDRDSGRIV